MISRLARGAAVAAVALGAALAPQPVTTSPSASSEGTSAALAPTTSGAAVQAPVPARRAAPRPDASPGRGSGVARQADPQGQVAATPGTSDDEVLPGLQVGPRVLAERPALLPELAARNNVDAPRLRSMLQDASTRVSTEGRVYFVDAAPEPQAGQEQGHDHAAEAERASESTEAAEATAAALGSGPAAARRYPSTETFRLESRPGASRTIWIDADGATVRGTAWNGTREGQIPDGTWAGYNREGSATSFTDAEHAWVQEVWRQVAEAYAAFDVNVTTLPRDAAAINRKDAADTTYGSHVLITSSATPRQAVCGGCLGVAYVGTFGHASAGQYQPAWVFVSDRTSATIAAQAVSHEVGHNLGLDHDGTATAGYFAGTSAWGPIMGSASGRAVSHWSRGEYSGANNQEDDLTVMQQHGLPRRSDDHGGTTTSATSLGNVAAYDVEGVIERATDVDVVALDVGCATTLRAGATGVGVQGTLDLQLDLLAADGALLVRDSPVSTAHTSGGRPHLDATLSRAVPAGRYYLRVDGVGSGAGSTAAASGWSDYASLGQYRLTATGCVAPAPAAAPVEPLEPVQPQEPTEAPPTGEPSAPGDPTPPTVPPVVTPPATAPAGPAIGRATPGRRGGRSTLVARWTAPAQDGGSAVTGYRVAAHQLLSGNRVRRTFRTGTLGARARVVQLNLPRGRYAVVVQAVNDVGASPWSRRSNAALAR